MTKDEIRAQFDARAADFPRWAAWRRAYHDELVRVARFLIPPGASVLELGSGGGDLLAAVEPARGVGVDLSPAMVELARRRHPHLEFRVGDAEQLGLEEKFDYVILSDLLASLIDVQRCFEQLAAVTRPDSRVVISIHNFLWQPLIAFAERVGMKMPQSEPNWLGAGDVDNLLRLTGFEVIRRQYRTLVPLAVPLLDRLGNGFLSQLPAVRRLCLSSVLVARPVQARRSEPLSVSVIVPTRNERGNIAAAIERLPQIGASTEIVFVDGNSTDGTAAEIERQIAAHPERRIRLIHQGDGVGKGDAVRKGFEAASGDVLMILDADLTVPPEDLPKFYQALLDGRGDFVNGTRLVYPMERQAMRTLNRLGNKFFAMTFSWLLDQRFKDTLCGTKALRRSDYAKISANRAFFGEFDPFGDFDLLFGAAKQNLKIVEVPIRYRERTYGETNIRRFLHGWLLLKMCVFAYRKLKVV